MFTGIIETVGEIRRISRSGQSAKLVVQAQWRDGVHPGVGLGDSVAVCGVCLTVVAFEVAEGGVRLDFDVSHETLDKTGLGAFGAGSKVNLERALRVGDRLGGHWVTGHVDGVGSLQRAVQRADYWDLEYAMPAELEPELVQKGSIAIDGVSLTVNRVFPGGFAVTVIPHTVSWTTLLDGGVGKRVNLETDVLAKYIRRLAETVGIRAPGIDRALLERTGFATPGDG